LGFRFLKKSKKPRFLKATSTALDEVIDCLLSVALCPFIALTCLMIVTTFVKCDDAGMH